MSRVHTFVYDGFIALPVVIVALVASAARSWRLALAIFGWMLVAAARKELGGAPIRLALEYPTTPAASLAAPKLAEAFTAAGVEIRLMPRPETDLEAELRSGRRFDLAYRATRGVEPAQRQPGRFHLGVEHEPVQPQAQPAGLAHLQVEVRVEPGEPTGEAGGGAGFQQRGRSRQPRIEQQPLEAVAVQRRHRQHEDQRDRRAEDDGPVGALLGR